MKFGNKKVMATIVAMAMATTLAGCSKDENNSVQSGSDTEKDLLTSSSSIDIWSAPESIDSTLNSHDTSKPIEKDENPTSDASSDDSGTSSDANSSLTDETSSNGTSDGDKSNSTGETSSQPSTGETSSSGETSKSETSKPSDNTTSVPSDSSLADDKNSSANSSSSNDANSSESSTTSNIYSNLPEGWIASKPGQAGTCTEEEYEAMIEAMRKGDEAIENGTYGTLDEETAAELDALLDSLLGT